MHEYGILLYVRTVEIVFTQVCMMYRIVYTKLNFSLLSEGDTSWMCYVPVYAQYTPHMCTWYIHCIYFYFLYFLCRLFESPNSVRLGMVSLSFHVVIEFLPLVRLFKFHNFSFYRCVTCFLFWMFPAQWRTRISNQIESHAHSRCGPFA